jgi:signal transduction histidine kinase/ActR/RegA family two-component response regulator
VRAAQTRLLYENANTGIAVTLVVAPLLAYFQWNGVRHPLVMLWLAGMLLISGARSMLVRRYWRASPNADEEERWSALFAVGAALAAAGWGGAGILLYPEAGSMNENLLIFVLGGMMLGGAALLAARPEAFMAFILPTGLLAAIRLGIEGDAAHVLMGLLATLFTMATLITSWRLYLMIESALELAFENRELVQHLQTAKIQADVLNRDLETRVRERTAELQDADQRKDEFLATLAHELRNPLAPIRFAIENLNASQLPAAAVCARDVIGRQVGQLVRLVDDLLDVSRITANKIHLRREPQLLGRLIATALESVTPLAAAAGHHLHVSEPPAPIWVNGDPTRLVQVFSNVLNNAVKFTPRGGSIWVSSAEDAATMAVVRIRDTGVGITPELLPRVFDMFQQAEPILERSTGGLGIGLTLARRLVAMHEGRIEVRSGGSGQGTEVEIKLPLVPAEEAAIIPFATLPAVARTLRVLIVDDNVDAAEMLALAVSGLGHLTRQAHDGAAALTGAATFLPDVIFLDIGLPIVNGYAVARALRERPEFNHVHIAAVTGWGQEEDRREGREAGCDSHFTKPLSPAALEHLLTSIAQPAPPGAAPHAARRTRLSDAAV